MMKHVKVYTLCEIFLCKTSKLGHEGASCVRVNVLSQGTK